MRLMWMQRNRLRIPVWVLPLLFIFSLSVVGLGISKFVGTFIPFWILLTFSLVFTIDKWFHYKLRQHKAIGILFRIFLNLSILSLIGLIIWTGIKLFSMQFLRSSLIGSLVFIGELVFLIWLWSIVAKNSWRKPSMKLTTFAVLAIAVIFAFAGVQPISTYKNDLVTYWNAYWEEQKVINEQSLAKAKIEEQKRIAEQAIQEQKRAEEQRNNELQIQNELNQSYAQLFNDFRINNGEHPLSFDPQLNKLAQQRAIEISQPGNFSHQGIERYNLGENIAMMAYSSDSNESLIELWASSPGHRSNMLSSSYHRTGFAREGRYAVQIFD